MKIMMLVMNSDVRNVPVTEYNTRCRALQFERDSLVGFDGQSGPAIAGRTIRLAATPKAQVRAKVFMSGHSRNDFVQFV
jgi:hypothetical protein